MKLRVFYLLLFVFVYQGVAFAQNFGAVEELINRRFPNMKGKVGFTKIAFSGYDSATYTSAKNKLVIKANTVNAASYALYDYIKTYCKSSLSHTGDNVVIPAILPATKKTGNISAVYPLRYALNYCTYNYTMSFWKWEDWERELDWMSLNGVNLMLAQIGTEEVWQKTMLELGFSDQEIRAFIPGPAFNGWWLMGNLEGWGGPVSDNMIKHWTSLQKKILTRMKELKIEPVVQAFTGLVPSTLKNHFPDAQIVDQGNWWGFKRPVVLLPKDDALFKKIAAIYYKNLKALYGSDFAYLGGDLFHEGGNTKGVNLTETANLIQKNMQEHFPGAVWVLQGWQNNPEKQILDGLKPEQTLILDLKGDDEENWLKRNQYGNFPWMWTTITNFGGKTTSNGTLMRVYTETKRAEEKFGKDLLLKGTGIIPEGIENNAIVYQWALDRSWQKNIPSIQENLEAFIVARYGTVSQDLKEGWQYLLQTIHSGYNPKITGGQGGYESIFCGRPDSNYVRTTSCCGPTQIWYDVDVLTRAAIHFEQAYKNLKTTATLQFDLTDTWRQVINLRGRMVYNDIMKAIKDKSKLVFETKKTEFIKLLELQDRWLGTNPMFKVGRWLNQARNMLPDAADKKLAEWNARAQITYWGGDTNPRSVLHDYANKEWQGLLKDLYLPRWNNFFAYAAARIDGKEAVYPDFFDMEKKWSRMQNEYSNVPEGNITELLQEIHRTVITNKQ
jgi:alpha-N-acetylglucosaminidase